MLARRREEKIYPEIASYPTLWGFACDLALLAAVCNKNVLRISGELIWVAGARNDAGHPDSSRFNSRGSQGETLLNDHCIAFLPDVMVKKSHKDEVIYYSVFSDQVGLGNDQVVTSGSDNLFVVKCISLLRQIQ